MRKTFKKIAASVMAATTLTVGVIGMNVSAAGETTGYLNVSYHYVPVLKDSARGTTCTNYGYTSLNSLWVQTTVYAYDKDGNSVTKTGNKCYGSAALEGWSDTEAVAEIRNINKAKGTHKGGTGSNYSTAYTSWNK